ncbi:phage tail protein [Pseudopedobacter beijingensis]|uniref:Phage tail protein n=1 Tax=Pseudopedobacter beijingensis TaxID=1207056 RepID=A0ABW4IE84_9SPHI
MSYLVDFKNVSEIGFETSPLSASLAGLRANEARYFYNKYKAEFVTTPVSDSKESLDWVAKILKEERNIIIASKPLETASLLVDGIKWIFVFYESGLSINVLYTIDNPKKRAVGFKLSEGMDIPEELSKFKFARQKSKLAGIIRGSFFVIKKEY